MADSGSIELSISENALYLIVHDHEYQDNMKTIYRLKRDAERLQQRIEELYQRNSYLVDMMDARIRNSKTDLTYLISRR